MEIKPTKYDLVCRECKEKFVMVSSTVPSDLCDTCVLPLIEDVWGCKLRRSKIFHVVEPVGGSSVG